MTFPIRLFARARDLARADAVTIELPAGATAGEVRRRLAVDIPALLPLLDHCAVAVNGEFADDDQVLAPGAEIALLPPVSGG
jgi:molybdopterin converting factor subunit 1